VPADAQARIELERQLDELWELLSNQLRDAEALASGHPVVVAGAAFLLGIAVGRLTKGP
jgi:hypothetical protein